MCKNSVYNVGESIFLHNQLTIDVYRIIHTVVITTSLHKILITFSKLILIIKSLTITFLYTITHFPQQLLLLLLFIKLHIINKSLLISGGL